MWSSLLLYLHALKPFSATPEAYNANQRLNATQKARGEGRRTGMDSETRVCLLSFSCAPLTHTLCRHLHSHQAQNKSSRE
ncbi:hypothetical protein BDZ97DRAFT_1814454 [Flammula alnicola]|nr:hypothetical protein BDZ97DRAFT_1814454 [Flammula alnicola]